MADKADIYRDAFNLMQQAEDEACERTLQTLRQTAEILNIPLEKLLDDVIPESRKRLIAYMARKAAPAHDRFLPMVRK